MPPPERRAPSDLMFDIVSLILVYWRGSLSLGCHHACLVTHFVTLLPHGQVSNVRWRPFILSGWGNASIKRDFRDNIYLSPEPNFVFSCPGSLPLSNIMLVMYFIHFLPLRSIQPGDNEWAIWLDTFCVVLSDTRHALRALHIAILITPSTFPRAVGRVWKFPKTFGTTWARSRLHHDKLYRLWHWADVRSKPIMLHEVPFYYKKDNLIISLVFLPKYLKRYEIWA